MDGGIWEIDEYFWWVSGLVRRSIGHVLWAGGHACELNGCHGDDDERVDDCIWWVERYIRELSLYVMDWRRFSGKIAASSELVDIHTDIILINARRS